VKRGVWLHRGLAGLFILLTIPAVLWWKTSILFVILLSLATQISTEFGAAAAADDRQVADRLDRIEALLGQRGGATVEHRMSFSFDLLTSAAERREALTVCPRGHLVVNDNTHWAPRALDHSLSRIDCVMVEREDCQ
jgi:hypothetical protein